MADKDLAAKDLVGKTGEALAASALEREGCVILDRNWRGTGGELDLVVLDRTALVAVEVKTRSSLRYGSPAEAITPQKLARLRRLTGQWLGEHRELGLHYSEVRLDVVAVLLPAERNPHLEWLKGVS